MIDYALILSKKFPNAEWSLNDNDYPEQLQWFDNSEIPSKDELDSYWDEVKFIRQAEADAKAAQRQALLERLGITESEAQLLLGGK
jgi:hypothetical protein